MNSRSYAQAHTWSHEHIIALRDMIQRDICILQIHWYTMIQYPLFLHPPKISMHTQKSFLHSFVTALCLLERWELSSSLWQVNFGMLENSLKPQKDTLKFHGLSVYTRNPLVFLLQEAGMKLSGHYVVPKPKVSPHAEIIRTEVVLWMTMALRIETYGIIEIFGAKSGFHPVDMGLQPNFCWGFQCLNWCACQLSSTAEQLLSWGQKPLKVMIFSWPRTTNTGIESQVWRRIKGIWYHLRSSQIKWNIRIATGNQPTNYIGHMWL